jgi:hypothetical protein
MRRPIVADLQHFNHDDLWQRTQSLAPVRFASGLKCSIASHRARDWGAMKRKFLFYAGSILWLFIIFAAFLLIASRM